MARFEAKKALRRLRERDRRMTDHDLDDLKQAMISQTPTPDAARRAATTQAQAAFARRQDNADTKGRLVRILGPRFCARRWGLVATAGGSSRQYCRLT